MLSHVHLFMTPWTAACQASLSITNSQSLLKLMSIELVMLSNHLILCHPLPLLPSIFSSIRVFQMSQLFASGGQSTRVSASLDLLAVQGILKSLLQSHSSKASILRHSAFFKSNSHIHTFCCCCSHCRMSTPWRGWKSIF